MHKQTSMHYCELYSDYFLVYFFHEICLKCDEQDILTQGNFNLNMNKQSPVIFHLLYTYYIHTYYLVLYTSNLHKLNCLN